VLSLQSGEVGFGSGLFGGSGFGLLHGLSGKELLFHRLGFKFLGGLFFLEFLKVSGSRLGKFFFVSSFLLSIADLLLELFILFDF
jgi:hypothetical protein